MCSCAAAQLGGLHPDGRCHACRGNRALRRIHSSRSGLQDFYEHGGDAFAEHVGDFLHYKGIGRWRAPIHRKVKARGRLDVGLGWRPPSAAIFRPVSSRTLLSHARPDVDTFEPPGLCGAPFSGAIYLYIPRTQVRVRPVRLCLPSRAAWARKL